MINGWVVQLGVYLPRAATHGVLVDWPAMVRLGRRNAVMAKTMLSLSALWSQPGTDILPRHGRCGRYAQSFKPDKYDQVMPIEGNDLTWLGYPTEGPSKGVTGRKRLERVRKRLDTLESMKWVKRTARSIMPGERWGGRGNLTGK